MSLRGRVNSTSEAHGGPPVHKASGPSSGDVRVIEELCAPGLNTCLLCAYFLGLPHKHV